MLTLPLNISKELQSESYYVESVKGWDGKLLHFYLTYLKSFLIQIQEQRFNPLEYTPSSAKKQLKITNTAIKSFEFLINKYNSLKNKTSEIEEICSTFKEILLELKSNKFYLETLTDSEKNKELRNSFNKIKLSNFLAH